jgi:hypothetical protein
LPADSIARHREDDADLARAIAEQLEALPGGVDQGRRLEPHHIADLETLRHDSCSMRALPRAGFLVLPLVLAICLLLIC